MDVDDNKAKLFFVQKLDSVQKIYDTECVVRNSATKSMEVLMTNFARELTHLKQSDANSTEGMREAKHKIIDRTIDRLQEIERNYSSRVLVICGVRYHESECELYRMIQEISSIEDDELEMYTCHLENRMKDLQRMGRERDIMETIEKLLTTYMLKSIEHKVKMHALRMIVRLYGDKANKAQEYANLEEEYIETLRYLTEEFQHVLASMRQRKLKKIANDHDFFYRKENPIIESIISTRQYHFGC